MMQGQHGGFLPGSCCPPVYQRFMAPSLRAKRSNPSFAAVMDCFATLAMTKNPDVRSPSPRNAPEALMNLPPKEGLGNAGCPMHAASCALCIGKSTRVTTSGVARMERSAIRVCFKFVPGFRGACHPAALRADPLAPSGLRCLRFAGNKTLNFLFVLAVGLVAGTVSGIVGTGSSIMLMPVLVYQYGPKQAVPIMAIAAVMANLSRILAWWRE